MIEHNDPTLTAAYGFDLPPQLIAQEPATPRDTARLLALVGGERSHQTFRDLPALLREGDLLVLNETRVIAARVTGARPSGGRAEFLLLRPAAGGRYDPAATRWQVLAKPGRKMREGDRVSFGDLGNARVVAVHEDGIREVEFALEVPFEVFLGRAGRLPLPPYIHNHSAQAQQRYQTIFARQPGSVAAPTASLHFTQGVFDGLHAKGVQIAKLSLNVGLGTFKPIQTERLDGHVMHGESFVIPQETTDAIAAAKSQGRRVIASGTTVMRALEGSASGHDDGLPRAGESETAIFITPPFQFHVVDALITNFHLPRTTLLVLVSAFAGISAIRDAYREAIELQYRFYSFGDAMFIQP